MALNYTLRDVDKYLLNITFRDYYNNTPHDFSNRIGTIYSSDSETPLSVSDLSSSQMNIPSLDIYFQKNLKNKQLLIFNLVGTQIHTETSREYTEKINQQALTDVYSQIVGNKLSLIAGVICT